MVQHFLLRDAEKSATCTASSNFIWRSPFSIRDTADGASRKWRAKIGLRCTDPIERLLEPFRIHVGTTDNCSIDIYR